MIFVYFVYNNNCTSALCERGGLFLLNEIISCFSNFRTIYTLLSIAFSTCIVIKAYCVYFCTFFQKISQNLSKTDRLLLLQQLGEGHSFTKVKERKYLDMIFCKLP